MQFYGLHHDDHEAFLCDIPTPLKNLLGESYDVIREGLDDSIARVLGVAPLGFHHERVKWADAVALRLEAYSLKYSAGSHPHWDNAWERFDLGHHAPLYLVPVEFKDRRPWTPLEAYHEYLKLHSFTGGTHENRTP
jgi:hypothetical protein